MNYKIGGGTWKLHKGKGNATSKGHPPPLWVRDKM